MHIHLSDIVVNSAHALLTTPVTYKPSNISNTPFIRLSGTSAYVGLSGHHDSFEISNLALAVGNLSLFLRSFVISNFTRGEHQKIIDRILQRKLLPTNIIYDHTSVQRVRTNINTSTIPYQPNTLDPGPDPPQNLLHCLQYRILSKGSSAGGVRTFMTAQTPRYTYL